jgi:hypothetical protein
MTAKPRPRGATARMLRQARLWQAALLVVLALAACSTAGGAASNGPATASTAKLTVTSTLDGHTALPHRIHWQALPSGPSFDVSEVDYLIDGKQVWVEQNTPYFYGSDGNYLVTSFLKPGKHVFTVRAIDVSGHVATDTVTATVPPALSPPAALAGTWKAWQPAGGAPAGYASLVIGSVGWYEGQFPSRIRTATWRTWHTSLPGWWRSGPAWPRVTTWSPGRRAMTISTGGATTRRDRRPATGGR